MTASPADAPRPRGRYPKGIARRQEILDKAIEVFAQRGSQKTSLRAIAQEVGVTHAALTHYFGSLEELLVEVYRESQRKPTVEKHAPPADSSPAAAMRLAAEENRAIPGLVQLYSTLVAMALEDNHPAAQQFATDRFARLRSDMGQQVRGLQASGHLRADLDPTLVAALVIAASDGLQTQWLLDATVDHEAALDMLDRLLRGGPTA
ncbi:TetR/AcrR family transcriptional regulator [Microbacterium kyungheense]|jgi:AcrR family transcriptional regulator|uniref:TetR family transcriptional regulator n=1 Tax=Microbacterium kyungheense TaxID=1263636 RepID=A0A543FJD2_9MICO|nr:TetR/AcrR family transcriptional regulator [Microbacterium kyungheense]TQM33872.1 TetR family transcriptional regulator [Microbacterium kyungheense]